MNQAKLEQIKSTVLEYNQENTDDELTLLTQNEKIKTNNLFICIYNKNKIGLFEKKSYHTDPKNKEIGYYRAWDVYKGYNSDYTAICLLHPLKRWYKNGDSHRFTDNCYRANCIIYDEISFDELRFIMYQQGKLHAYTIGTATQNDLLNVLNFAYNYLYNEKKKIRSKSFFR